MNRSDLINSVATETGLSKKDADAAISAFINTVENVLKAGDKLQLVGFGTFETSKRAARTGRNPQTGEDIKIPASVIPKFKAGAKLKEAAAASDKSKKTKKTKK